MAIDYTSKVKLKGGLSEGTLKQMEEVSKAEAKVGKYVEKAMENFLDSAYSYTKQAADTKMEGLEKEQAEQEAANKEAQKKLDKISEEVLAVQGSLGDNYFDSVYDDLEELKNRYVEAEGEKEKAKIMQEMNAYKTEVEGVKQLRNDMADSNSGGLLSNSMTKEQKHIMSQFLENKTEVFKRDGKRMHRVTLEDGAVLELSSDEIADMQNLKDTEFDLYLNKTMETALNSGSENKYFDINKVEQQIENSITDDNLASLVNDPMGGGKSFKADLAEGLKNSNLQYKDLGGLLEDGAVQPDNNEEFWYDNISEQDIQAITDALTNPNNQYYKPDVTKSALKKYFTTIVQNNNKAGSDYRNKSGEENAVRSGTNQAITADAKQDELERLGRGGNSSIKGANVR